MLVVMKALATPEEIKAVCEHIEALGYRAHPLPGAQRTAIGITGNQGEVDRGNIEELPGVAEVIRVSKPYKLVSRDVKEEDTVIRFPGTDATIGGAKLAIIAGPCSIESREQAFAIAEQVALSGAQFLRGGAYKPRTSPYAFQGLGEEALKIMAEVRERFGLRIVTEAIDHEALELVAEYADVIQIGARNMQNFSLLRRVSQMRKPVLLKRGLAATLEEWLMAAEYVMAGGNYNVVLCERGVRTFSDHSRNTLDLSVIPPAKRLSHLPVLVDPSHGTGKRDYVPPMALAGLAAGADGLLIEVHPDPDRALSDGAQSLTFGQFTQLQEALHRLAVPLGRKVN
jgi:3-deoxy-7-phosphoheptulonate synthase